MMFLDQGVYPTETPNGLSLLSRQGGTLKRRRDHDMKNRQSTGQPHKYMQFIYCEECTFRGQTGHRRG